VETVERQENVGSEQVFSRNGCGGAILTLLSVSCNGGVHCRASRKADIDGDWGSRTPRG